MLFFLETGSLGYGAVHPGLVEGRHKRRALASTGSARTVGARVAPDTRRYRRAPTRGAPRQGRPARGGGGGVPPPPPGAPGPPRGGARGAGPPPPRWRRPPGGKARQRLRGVPQESAVKPIFLISGPQVSYSAFCQRACSSGVEPWGIRPTMARLSMTDFSFRAALMAALAAAITGLGVAAGA